MENYNFSRDFYNLIERYPNAKNLINQLQEHGELLFFGGSVREYNESKFQNIPRDFDIVIKKQSRNINLDIALANFKYKKNRFDGYKIKVDTLEFDIWELENTWAFKENKIQCLEEDYSSKLKDTVFLNIDSVVYNLTTEELYDDLYEKAMKDRVLDVILEENPYIELNMLRAIVFKEKYNMTFSEKLIKILSEFIYYNNDYLDKLYQIQLKHYCTYKFDKRTLENQIRDILAIC